MTLCREPIVKFSIKSSEMVNQPGACQRISHQAGDEFRFNLNPSFLMVYFKNSLTMTGTDSRVAAHRKCGGHCVSYQAVVCGRGRALVRARARTGGRRQCDRSRSAQPQNRRTRASRAKARDGRSVERRIARRTAGRENPSGVQHLVVQTGTTGQPRLAAPSHRPTPCV